jgi:RNA recognition motif-containing protein
MVIDKSSSKPKGYAFIEYEHERDMHGKVDKCHA